METEIQGKLVKVGSAWGAIGITSWADAASAIAFFYTLALFCEWAWKKIVKPMLIRREYMKSDGDKEDAE